MPNKGLAVLISLNGVGPAFYEGWDGESGTSRNDGDAMEDFLRLRGFGIYKHLKNSDATRSAALSAIQDAAHYLEDGGFLVVYFSGHGSQLPDLNMDEKNDQKVDQVWCLYDGMLIDDELAYIYHEKARAGQRVLTISDSCHAGTVGRRFLPANAFGLGAQLASGGDGDPTEIQAREKLAPDGIARRIYRFQRDFYRPPLGLPTNQIDMETAVASVLSLGACADNETAYEGVKLSFFTEALIEHARAGCALTYEGLETKLKAALKPKRQTPQLVSRNKAARDFAKTTAFVI